ncbi:hypothetical protein HELRODRAFT_177820 [Helobdella robusta]|uniref:Antistasin-like domain-containing protein n=1 Tax=Helobdella robusta TaxID=6412 RepID=T1FCB7_HELRO|nr:hypothetical protein HELRODRAFT_177820 [Helobdella robusta]ESN97758.1 hypothetical protein HELRODRAFT_177820 [Helobdella robusta]
MWKPGQNRSKIGTESTKIGCQSKFGHISKPCKPRDCHGICPGAYQRDADGCEICECTSCEDLSQLRKRIWNQKLQPMNAFNDSFQTTETSLPLTGNINPENFLMFVRMARGELQKPFLSKVINLFAKG